MELEYAYVTGGEFQRRVQTTSEVLADMEQDLDKGGERAFRAAWAR